MYRLSAFFAAKTLSTFPFEVFQTILFAVVTYFMIGFQSAASKFYIFTSALVMFMLVSETIGVLQRKPHVQADNQSRALC
jgi:ATP-binding cassette, subfamily G (WHITE), member 2